VSADFLSVDAVATAGGQEPIARSPMERAALAAGARFEVRDGWSIAVHYGAGAEAEARACRDRAGWADVSPLGKLELQAPPGQLEAVVAGCADGAGVALGTATRAAAAWWCRLTPQRLLVICAPAARSALREKLTGAAAGAAGASVVDVTSNFAALTVAGPLAREVLARFSAIDLRPRTTPVGALRPGSIARQPAILICEAENRYLFLFGWATGEYIWSVVSDAGRHLGGQPIGADALAAIDPGRPRAAEGSAPAEERARA